MCTDNLVAIISSFNFSDVIEQLYSFVVVGYKIFVVGEKAYMVVAVYGAEEFSVHRNHDRSCRCFFRTYNFLALFVIRDRKCRYIVVDIIF